MLEADVAVIGAGVAGLSAAAACARAGLSVLVVERMGAGGQVMTVENILNWPGHEEGIAGFELGPMLQEAAESAGAQFHMDTVVRVEPGAAGGGDARHRVHGEADVVAARAIVLAMGSSRAALGLPGETALAGRGVSHCASCDGPLFRGDSVCVVGGGDSAVGEALVLAAHAREVALVFAEAELHAQPYLLQALAACENVRLHPRSRVVGIDGETAVEAVRLQTPEGETRLATQGVFIYAGLVPNSQTVAPEIARDAAGRLVTDARLATGVPRIYACGDVRAEANYVLRDAAREGELAGRSVVDDLKGIRS